MGGTLPNATVAKPLLPGTGIHFEKIDKRYGGLFALRGVCLEVAAGECVALAGRNGSGKTTLLRIASRLVRPSAGSVTFPEAGNGESVRPGYVAHTTMVYDELTAEENLVLFAKLQSVERPEARAEELLRDVGLYERRGSLVRTFSRGMRQRIAIARALLHRPSILLLDEPATGLDPIGFAWLAETLRGLKAAGCTMLMSVHGESEITEMATRGILLDAGRIVADTKEGATLRSVVMFGGG